MKPIKSSSIDYYNELKESGLSERTSNLIVSHEESLINSLINNHLSTKDDIRTIDKKIDMLLRKMELEFIKTNSKIDMEIIDVNKKFELSFSGLNSKIEIEVIKLDKKIDRLYLKIISSIGLMFGILEAIQHFFK